MKKSIDATNIRLELRLPPDARLFDVEGVPVAKLPDGSVVAFRPDASPYHDPAKVFAYGMPVSDEDFALLVRSWTTPAQSS